VLGSGSAFVTPDVADLSVSVSRSGSSSHQALYSANRATHTVVRAIRAVGIAASDIQTEDVSVSSAVRGSGTHKRHVWTASESLSVHVTNINLVGRVIDQATGAQASSVDGPTFSFSDPSAGLLQATRAAIADARRRADDAASAIGYRVSGVQSVQLDVQNGGGASAPGTSAAPSAGTPTQVSPGKEEVDERIEVVYTITPA
jgi:uncharacterized protein YggE